MGKSPLRRVLCEHEDPSSEEEKQTWVSEAEDGGGKREMPSNLTSCLPLLKAGGGNHSVSIDGWVTFVPDPVGLAGTVFLSRLILKQNWTQWLPSKD